MKNICGVGCFQVHRVGLSYELIGRQYQLVTISGIIGMIPLAWHLKKRKFDLKCSQSNKYANTAAIIVFYIIVNNDTIINNDDNNHNLIEVSLCII